MEIEGDIFDVDVMDDVEMSDDEFKEELKVLEEEEERRKTDQIEKQDIKTENSCSVSNNEETILKSEDKTNERNGKMTNERKDKTTNEKCDKRTNESNDKRTSQRYSDQGVNKYKLFRPLDVTKDMEPMWVGREIAYRLQEKKVNLIGHVVRVIGFTLSIEVFDETKKIVQSGGLKTDTGDRKRSPGGVFLYILKNRGYASDKQMKEIFKIENEKTKESRKKKALSKKVEKRKYLMEKDGK